MKPDFLGFYNNLFRIEEWNIGVIYDPISVFLEPGVTSKIHWFPPPERGKLFADPFVVTKDKRAYILCEEFDYRSGKGRIVSFDLSKGIPRPEVALELPVHASYPYLLEYDGEIYCVPETSQAREIGLYRAQDFPNKWTKAGTLLSDFAGVDPTVFQYEGRWWLACANRDDGQWEKLFLWHSEDLSGPWISHRMSPVKTDIHSSRPAGTPFMHKGSLYRPAQDCSRTYGGRIKLNRIVVLTPTQFKEQEVLTIEPQGTEPYPEGMHTISSAGGIVAIDGKRLRLARTIFEFERNLKRQGRYLRRKFSST